jgi:hypothetical protein
MGLKRPQGFYGSFLKGPAVPFYHGYFSPANSRRTAPGNGPPVHPGTGSAPRGGGSGRSGGCRRTEEPSMPPGPQRWCPEILGLY